MNSLLRRVRQLNNNLIIRRATRADVSGFTSLINKHYARKNNENYFLWRFFSCPTPSVLYIITTKKDIIIGAYGVNVFTLSNGKKCGLTVDLVISDKYTRRGLFFLLEDKISTFARRNNCMYLLSIPNALGMQAHTKIAGWQMLRTIPILTLKHGTIKATQNYQTINNLNKKTLAIEYNKSLLNWRLMENPEYKYFRIRSGKNQSYIKIFFDATRKILFGDLVYYSSSDSKSEFSILINKSVQKFKSMNAQKIITWCDESSPLYQIFLSLGFIPENQPRYLCVKPLSPKALNPEQFYWHILPADSEAF